MWADSLRFRRLSARTEYIARLKADDPQRAQKLTDFDDWVMTSSRARIRATADALSLRHDIERGRTHILFIQVSYQPHNTGRKHKFHIDACNVFRIRDVVEIMSMIMRMSEQDVQACIDQRLSRVDPSSATVSMLSLSYEQGGEIADWSLDNSTPSSCFTVYMVSHFTNNLTYDCIAPVSMEFLRTHSEHSNWRCLLDRDSPPDDIHEFTFGETKKDDLALDDSSQEPVALYNHGQPSANPGATPLPATRDSSLFALWRTSDTIWVYIIVLPTLVWYCFNTRYNTRDSFN